jgi:membrane-bound serine protease (ClpP class)
MTLLIGILFAVAIALLLVESLIPDFGICGLIGLLALGVAGALGLLYTDYGTLILCGVMFLGAATIFTVYKTLTSKRARGTLILDEQLQTPAQKEVIEIGAEGVSLSTLRPVGLVKFHDIHATVLSSHGQIDIGDKVRVVRIEDGSLYVDKIKAEGVN